MKNVFKLILVIISFSIFLGFGNKAFALSEETFSVDLFYGNGCPHCAKERDFLNKVLIEYSESVKLNEYEIYYNQENSALFNLALKHFSIDVGGVPFLIIGDDYIIGYGSDETTGIEIKEKLQKCIFGKCENIIEKLKLGLSINEDKVLATSTTDNNNSKSLPIIGSVIEKDNFFIELPLFGKVDLKSISLPIATIVIAFVDGFNPCAMWILVFLITMLINMKDRKKLYTLGSVFIFTSGLVYFVFLAAWFNFFKWIGYVYWIKFIIGIVAIISGVLHIKNSILSKGECHATNEKQRVSIIAKIKKIISEKSYFLAIAGMVVLAISVNLIEVVCSAGLPAVFTNLLSSIELTTIEYYAYLLLYVIIFMLDDLLIFFIAVKTFEITGIAKKYTKWSGIIGGIIILIIGIILIFKPELLMFG